MLLGFWKANIREGVYKGNYTQHILSKMFMCRVSKMCMCRVKIQHYQLKLLQMFKIQILQMFCIY